MNFYAVLSDDGICHTIMQSSNADLGQENNYVLIDEYDEKYLGSHRGGTEWSLTPGLFTHRRVNSAWEENPSNLTQNSDGTFQIVDN